MLVKILFECCLLVLVFAEMRESPPEFDQDFESYQFEIGSNVTVYCDAHGDVPMNFTWYTPRASIIPSDYTQRIFSYESGNSSALYIINFTYNDTGFYTCSASNLHGLTEKIYNITYAPKGDNETEFGNFFVTVNKVTENSVSFDIKAPGRSKTIEVMYKEVVDSNVSVISWYYGSKYEIRNLTAGGNYSFNFTVSTASGNFTYRMRKVILLPDAPEVIFKSLHAGSLQIEWFRKFDDFSRSTIDKYELSYSLVEMRRGDFWKNKDCGVTIQIPSCFSPSYTISNLSKGWYYEIRLRAHTSAGFGKFYRNKIRFPDN